MQNNTLPIHVLLADDLEADAFFIEQALSHSKVSNVVHWVRDGQEVIDFLRRKGKFVDKPRPHLILLDIHMPRKDGYETLREIKHDEDFGDIPVIMMSNSQDSDDVSKSYRAFASAYVPKKNGFEDMLGFVHAIETFWFLKARLPQENI